MRTNRQIMRVGSTELVEYSYTLWLIDNVTGRNISILGNFATRDDADMMGSARWWVDPTLYYRVVLNKSHIRHRQGYIPWQLLVSNRAERGQGEVLRGTGYVGVVRAENEQGAQVGAPPYVHGVVGTVGGAAI